MLGCKRLTINATTLDQVNNGSVAVREMDERVVVSKNARGVEEVVIHGEAYERTAAIQDMVRRTDVNVELGSDARSPGSTETTSTPCL